MASSSDGEPLDQLPDPHLTEDNLLAGLNPAQRAAVTCESDVIQILAPPGSGKTKTLTTRTAWLLFTKDVKPWNIIVTTFTVKAAREMKQRIGQLIGDGRESRLILGTFHSICYRYLRRYGIHIGLRKSIGVADSADSLSILKKVMKDLGGAAQKNDINFTRSRISNIKARGMTPDEGCLKLSTTQKKTFLEVYQGYEAALAKANLLDYDDLLLRTVDLLEKYPRCVSNIEYLLVDEYQDTSIVQFELVRLFAQARNRITVVGDPDQSIYSFRAAEIENLNRMKIRYPDLQVVFLEENYRSAGAILQSAQTMIEQDTAREKKPLVATHGYGLWPVLRKLDAANTEALWIVREIKRMRALTGNLLCYNDFAILLRSAFLSRLIETAMGKQGMPYKVVGGLKFFDRVEIKCLVDYMRVVAEPRTDEALKRILNMPPRSIGETSIGKIVAAATEQDTNIWAIISNGNAPVGGAQRNSLARLVDLVREARRVVRGDGIDVVPLTRLFNFLLNQLDVENWLKKTYAENDSWESRWENVQELGVIVNEATARFESGDEDLDALPEIDDLEQAKATASEDVLSNFLANLALSTAGEHKAEGALEAEPADQVTISTIHAAKGLEWGIVFIPSVTEGMIPHSRSEDIDEERRLLYVAMTRAKAMLYLSQPAESSRGDGTSASSFTEKLKWENKAPDVEISDVKTMAKILYRECPDPDTIFKAIEDIDGKVKHTDEFVSLRRGDSSFTEHDDEDEEGEGGERRPYNQYGSRRPTTSTTPRVWPAPRPVPSTDPRANAGFQSASSMMANTTMSAIPQTTSYGWQTTQAAFQDQPRKLSEGQVKQEKRKSVFDSFTSAKRIKSEGSVKLEARVGEYMKVAGGKWFKDDVGKYIKSKDGKWQKLTHEGTANHPIPLDEPEPSVVKNESEAEQAPLAASRSKFKVPHSTTLQQLDPNVLNHRPRTGYAFKSIKSEGHAHPMDGSAQDTEDVKPYAFLSSPPKGGEVVARTEVGIGEKTTAEDVDTGGLKWEGAGLGTNHAPSAAAARRGRTLGARMGGNGGWQSRVKRR